MGNINSTLTLLVVIFPDREILLEDFINVNFNERPALLKGLDHVRHS
ncbi:hypothetical protein [Jiulongibacter sp. NS-SX5]